VATLLLLLSAQWLASNTLKAPHLGMGLLIASGSVLFFVLNGYQMGALAGLESYKTIARIGALHGVLHLALCSAAAWFWGLNGAIAGFAVSTLLRWIISHRALAGASSRYAISFLYRGILKEGEIIFKFALPAALSGLVATPALWLVYTILVRQHDGYSQMGLFSAAASLKTAIIFLPQLINNVGMSIMNNQKGEGNQNNYRKVFWLNMALTAGIVFVGASVIALSGGWILRLFGKDFGGGQMVVAVLAISTIPEAIALAAYQIIQSKAKMWLSFSAVVLPREFTSILAAYLLIPKYGALGLAYSYMLSQTVAFLLVVTISSFLGLGFAPADHGLKAHDGRA
jgi:O-antigen/teichoic acid export membrane protein